MRKISKTLTLMGLLTPVGANALGVGEIELQSALNQVLEAEIPLITSTSESASDISVTLASPEVFANAGIERPFYLSKLRFTPVVTNGRVVIKVSSQDVIREPFLNFLVEVNWPKGRTLREFTVLLDPPATFDETVITASRAPRVQSTTVTKPRYPVDQATNFGFRSKSQSPGTTQRASAQSYQSGDIIRSKTNDTLWGLAKRVNSDRSVSQEQMMMALYEANPNAFFKKNINALKAGQRLEVPARETILKINRREALSEFKTQNAQWTGSVASSSANAVPPAVAKDNQASVETATGESTAKVELLSPATGEKVASGSSQIAAQANADLAQEKLDTVRQENEELRGRLKQAEEQMSRLQQMLTLKDKELSELQSQKTKTEAAPEKIMDLAGTQSGRNDSTPANQPAEPAETAVAPVETAPQVDEAPATTVTGPGEPGSPVEPGQEPVQSASTDGQTEAVIKDREPIMVEDVKDEPSAPVQPGITATTPEPEGSQTVAAGPGNPPQTSAKTSQPDDATSQSDDLSSDSLSQPTYWAAGGVAVFLGMLGWVLVRRRNRIMMADYDADNILGSKVSGSDGFDKDNGSKNLRGLKNNSTDGVESSFLSEFTPSDFDAFETDHEDVDPVSEADVYLAYGRYQQAEDLIRNAIETYPERDECKLKLLEIHFATEDREAFENYARDLESFKTQKPALWAKISEMGREICPHSPLFGAVKSAQRGSLKDNLPKANFSTDNTVQVGSRELEIQTGARDFDTDGLDFEMPNTVDAGKEFGALAQDPDTNDNSIDFVSFNDDTDFDFSRRLEKNQSGTELKSELEADLENFDFGDDKLEDLMESTDQSASNAGSETSDLTDMDEIETKLDLAKAYFDMDDSNSARTILSEILLEGNEEQKSEARALVDLMEHKV